MRCSKYLLFRWFRTLMFTGYSTVAFSKRYCVSHCSKSPRTINYGTNYIYQWSKHLYFVHTNYGLYVILKQMRQSYLQINMKADRRNDIKLSSISVSQEFCFCKTALSLCLRQQLNPKPFPNHIYGHTIKRTHKQASNQTHAQRSSSCAFAVFCVSRFSIRE
jgi:hypothetical protein